MKKIQSMRIPKIFLDINQRKLVVNNIGDIWDLQCVDRKYLLLEFGSLPKMYIGDTS